MNMAIAYGMKKRMAKGGMAERCVDCDAGQCHVHGGSAMSHGGEAEDIVSRIMKARGYSEGGRVANEGEDLADFAPNEFDDLALRDDLESSYTGKDSGDELGNAEMDEDDRDVVARIMKSRKLKDKMPRPA